MKMAEDTIQTYRERAKLRLEDRDRYTVDNGKVCRCKECAAEHYRLKKQEILVEQEAQRGE
jgi:hypothetical protein